MSRRIAVIGGGAAGLAAAYGLAERHAVTLYEEAPQLGGHALTFVVPDGPDAGTPLDVGFMVMNDRNYPHLTALFERLGGITLAPSEMSFSYHSREAGVSYGLNWSEAGGVERPVVPLLAEIVKFMRQATRDLAADAVGAMTLGEYFAWRGFSERLIQTYLLPMGAAIWSAEPEGLLGCSAGFVLGFYRNHGMLALKDQPQWQHVEGGSRTYVEAIRKVLGESVKVGTAARSVTRSATGVRVVAADGTDADFDAVVLATHADQALALLTDPSEAETRLLGAWRYQPNHAVLHTDRSVMPEDPATWASWNFAWEPEATGRGPTVTYHLNRLQGHVTSRDAYFLTLNPLAPISEAQELMRFDFTHPVYSAGAIATQAHLMSLSGERGTYYCGNYLGYGFHEDAIRSGLAVAAALGGLSLEVATA